MNLTLLAEFYKQSHITVPHKSTGGFDTSIEDTVFVPEKFAELIINECQIKIDEYIEEATGEGILDFPKYILQEHFWS